MKTSTLTYAIGAVQFAFGIIGLVTGWIDAGTATTLIATGAGIFGITHQNTTLGNSLGKAV